MAQKFIIKQKQDGGGFLDLYPQTSADNVQLNTNTNKVGTWWNVQVAIENLYPIYQVWAADSDTEDPKKLVNKIQEILEIFSTYPEGDKVLEALNKKLDLSGGTMKGNLNMGNYNINNIKTLYATDIGTSDSPISQGYFKNFYSEYIGTTNKQISYIYTDHIGTRDKLVSDLFITTIGSNTNSKGDPSNDYRVENIYAKNIDTSSITASNITATGISTSNLSLSFLYTKVLAEQGGGLGFYYNKDKTTGRETWHCYKPNSGGMSGQNPYGNAAVEDNIIAIKKDITGYAAAKIIPKSFSDTADGETIDPSSTSSMAFSAVSVNDEGIVTAYGQSIITGKDMDTDTLAEWGIYFSFID